MHVLEVVGLSKTYGSLRAVTDLSFAISPGEIVGLVGPNGAGKTSTLRCLAGVVPPTTGAVRIGGFDVATSPVQSKQLIAFLPDEPRLFEYLTVREHLNLTARLYGVRDWEARAVQLLRELELEAKESSLPSELSRGMKQKLTIACAFLHDPSLILLDEPLTGLDPLSIRNMKVSLRARAQRGAAILLSSHLLPLVEEICHRILVMSRGRCVALGSLDEIRAHLGAASTEASGSLEDVFVRITSSDEGRPAS